MPLLSHQWGAADGSPRTFSNDKNTCYPPGGGRRQVVGSTRLLIVDDDSAIREVLRVSLESDWEIVGEAENGMAAIEATDELQPDVVLLDVSMPVMNGFAAAKRLKETRPDI